jgi:glycosyltransferase involved in cell wall biosynthesis
MKKEDRHISIIIPVYNGSAYISDTLQSVKQQSYINWECIIIDDGSTDDTEKIIGVAIAGDNRFIYNYQQNQGLSVARNAGLKIASGRLIQFLDADDILMPSKLEKQLVHFDGEHKEYVVSYTDYATGCMGNIYKQSWYYVTGKFNSGNYLNELIERWEFQMSIPPHAFMFSASLFKNAGIHFDTSLPNHEDFDCWIQVFRQKVEVKYLDEKLCIYRVTEGSMSKNMRLMGEGFLQVINKHLAIEGYSKKTKRILLAKRLTILQRYKRFDLMTFYDKLASFKILFNYYCKRIFE